MEFAPIGYALLTATVVLIAGDFSSTFCYHVPQHLWFKLHLRTHHDRRKTYWDHAVLSRDPAVLLDGFLGALPYMLVAAFMARVSLPGALIGLALGQLHVWWRHTTDLGWRTPVWVRAITRPLGIVLPEDHDGHHRNPQTEFGDIFRFFDAPAQALIAILEPTSRKRRRALLRLGRQPVRM